jgi:hypothetical protein
MKLTFFIITIGNNFDETTKLSLILSEIDAMSANAASSILNLDLSIEFVKHITKVNKSSIAVDSWSESGLNKIQDFLDTLN